MQDFPAPALPITKNLNRKSEKKESFNQKSMENDDINLKTVSTYIHKSRTLHMSSEEIFQEQLWVIISVTFLFAYQDMMSKYLTFKFNHAPIHVNILTKNASDSVFS